MPGAIAAIFAFLAAMSAAAPQPEARTPRRRVLTKLRSKYRLLLINDRTFEERFSIRLSRINVLLLALGGAFLLSALVTSAIVFTPLKKMVPGYSDHDLRRYALRSTLLADSLARVLPMQEAYVENLRRVLTGEVRPDSAGQLRPVASLPTGNDLRPSRTDSLMRQRMTDEETYSLDPEHAGAGKGRDLPGIVFFPPLRGVVTENYDRPKGHLGVDIVTKPDEAVKAALDGTVVFASWTSDGGHVIQVQHANDLLTIYKHNAVLLKKVGDRVKGGEAIAITGDSGELSDGPHLHFELWMAGNPIDPRQYIVFQ